MDTVELIKIQEMVNDLKKSITDLTQSRIVQQRPNRSSEIHDLAVSLAKAQAEMPVADLNKTNPFFKSRYADLMCVVETSRPSLTKHGLSVTQQILHDEDGAGWLVTTLWHVSGQWIESRVRIIPTKNDIQSIQSHITYLKRSCYASLVGVVTGDEDDDGEKAVATTRETYAKGVALNTKYNPKETSADVITKEQLADYEYELAEYPDIAEMILDGLKIQSLADIPRAKHQAAITRVRQIKALRNGTLPENK